MRDMFHFKSYLVMGLSFSVLAGCLETRNSAKEVEEKQVLRKQVSNLQQTTAEVNAKFNEIDEDLRKMMGRIDQLELRFQGVKDRLDKADAARDQRAKEQDLSLAAVRDEFTKLNKDLIDTRAIAQSALQAFQAGGSASGAASAAERKDPFKFAEAKFEEKAYREAIFAYEDYRKASPKGKQVLTATYKIGVCFHELGLNEDAKLFFEEVIAKAPKSKEASLSRNKLKAMAKGNKRSPSADDPE